MPRSARVPASFAGPRDQDHEKPHNQDGQDPAERKLIPWKPIGAAVTSIGAPAGIGLLHPALGAAVFLTELAVSLIILGTALFGAKEYSERAFRMLRWIANRPEPAAPPVSTASRAINLSAAPNTREDEHCKTVRAEIVPVTGGKEDTQEITGHRRERDDADLHQLTAGT